MYDYIQTILSPYDESFADDYQNDYDWFDSYSGCPDYAEYMQTWN